MVTAFIMVPVNALPSPLEYNVEAIPGTGMGMA